MKKENVKIESDSLIKLSVSYLRKNGYFHGLVTGDIPTLCGGVKGGYHIIVSTLNKDAPYLHLSCSIMQSNGERKDLGYYVDLVTTKCGFGGERFWFLCPITIDGKPCGKRVAVLYKGNDFFGCRECHNLTYKSQKLSGIRKKFGVINMPELHSELLKIKRLRYKGWPTKKILRFNKKCEKAVALASLYKVRGDNMSKKNQEKHDEFMQKYKGTVININGLTALNMPAGYTTDKLGNFIIYISGVIDRLNKNENANISGSLDNNPSDHGSFLTIKVPNSRFRDPKGIVSFDFGDSIDFKFWYVPRPNNKSEVRLRAEFYITGRGSVLTAKEITCFDEFVRSIGFESENKLFAYEPGIFGGYAFIHDDLGELYWTKAV